MEGDFLRLHLNDIEDMLLLVVQNRLFNLNGEKKLNISRPLTYKAGINDLEPYTAYSNPQGVIYLDKLERNTLMCSHELYKFSDGTLISVRDKLKDMDNNLKIRRLMRRLEKFVGGREYGENLRLLQRTIWLYHTLFYSFSQNRSDLPRDIPLDRIEVLSDEVLKLKNFKKDDYTSFQDQEKYEHVSPKVTSTQEGKISQDDDKRLYSADDLKKLKDHTEAFEKLKQHMIELPTLVLSDFLIPFDVTTYASGSAIGAVLSQRDHPLVFFSKNVKLKNASCFYLYTRDVCNHRIWQALEALSFGKKLLGYEYDIFYKLGKENPIVDALSRIDSSHTPTFCAFTTPTLPWLGQLRKYFTNHQEGQEFVKIFKTGVLKDYNIHSDLVFFRDRLYILDVPGLRHQLIQEAHSTPIGGHSGIKTSVSRLASSFFCPKMHTFIQAFVEMCQICQQHKYSTQKSYGLLTTLPILARVWEDISMDFITHLAASYGKTTIWVIVDRLTKFAHFLAPKPNYTTATLASLFTTEIIPLHSIPRSVVSDRDPLFLSNFWKEIFRVQGTTLNYSSAYHSQSDGQTKVLNRTLESYLRCFTSDEPSMWSEFLPLTEFKVGDWVYLKLKKYRQISVEHRSSQKLAKRFYGPFRLCKGLPDAQISLLPPLSIGSQPILELEKILATQDLKTSEGNTRQLFVKWTSLGEDEATWEMLSSFISTYLQFNLGDKVVFQDGCTDTAPTSGPNDAPARNRPKRLNTRPYWAKDYV
ncbi:ty3-gypsy retrotransposon protein [Tanacetum coccineum]